MKIKKLLKTTMHRQLVGLVVGLQLEVMLELGAITLEEAQVPGIVYNLLHLQLQTNGILRQIPMPNPLPEMHGMT